MKTTVDGWKQPALPLPDVTEKPRGWKRIVPIDGPGDWKIHMEADGLHLLRPAARVYIPYEQAEMIAGAIMEAVEERSRWTKE